MQYWARELALLQWHASRPMEQSHCRGYEWLSKSFLPLLKYSSSKMKGLEDNETLSNAYLLLGDLHETNDAPKQAINAYRESISHSRSPVNRAYALYEIGRNYSTIGKYQSSIETLKQAIDLCPDNDDFRSELYMVQGLLDDRESPVIDLTNPCYEALDLLAQSRPADALEVLRGKKGVFCRRIRASCHGAMDHFDDYLKEWMHISRMKSDVELDYFDWFYMPRRSFLSRDLWKIFAKISDKERFLFCVFHHVESILRKYLLPISEKDSFTTSPSLQRESRENRRIANAAYGEICQEILSICESGSFAARPEDHWIAALLYRGH